MAPRPAILIKLAGAPDQGFAGLKLGARGARKLTPLFGVGTPDPALAGLAPGRPRAWFRAEGSEDGYGSNAEAWDAAHAAVRDGLGVAGAEVLAAEPDLEQVWPLPRPAPGFGAAGGPEGEKGAPFETGGSFGWHLDPDHSDLRRARDKVGKAAKAVTIVHLDTGFDPGHRIFAGLNLGPQKNFVEANRPDDATDETPPRGVLTNRGHGTGTLGLLAGGNTAGLRSNPAIPADFGAIGGAPAARIVPVRIANSVVHFWTSTVAQGIDYARRIGADVISMSMGGLPAASWADAVNAAYEAGIVIVCAAGNSFDGKPTGLTVYPARFGRVLAACGVMAAGRPYHGLGGQMEGCAGPESKMWTAMAAYTPNTPWCRIGSGDIIDMDGAGTSSATPQVAAAAALWLARHGAGLERNWQRVEATRAALFKAAARPGDQPDGAVDPLLGRGLLRARAALDIPPAPASLRQTPPDSASLALIRLLTGAFGATEPDPRRLAMLRLELAQLALATPEAGLALPDPDAPAADPRALLEAVLEEGKPSAALRARLESELGRGAAPGAPAPSPTPTPSPTPAGKPRPGGPKPGSGAAIPRRMAEDPKPIRRRLRVFATDPGDSRSLSRSFVNTATIEVPWEDDLAPGPVGEYVEVVDVDPASDTAYRPVDLTKPGLLAQEGLAPSEGNPQFHQQMVYAVAMRTIRNFEVALGRRALWADRVWTDDQGVVHRDFVRRLRLYPHALREQNAYYSPDHVALLFGYFDQGRAESQSRHTVFTCLSHDIIAHETTHALLDGLHRRFKEPTNPDAFAFHEAFADIVAIFQHFTFPELLRYELGRVRGDLSRTSILSDLARQFGRSLHNDGALRRALDASTEAGLADADEAPAAPASSYMDETEPHARGAILVAAIFEAFVAIYRRRTEDLIRIATAGSGVLGAGALPPDLVERLAQEAVAVAQRVLTSAIRALDYMPPVDPTFGDYLRAIVTADADFSPDARSGFRVAFASAFARRGIYPDDVPIVSPDGLLWQGPVDSPKWVELAGFLRGLDVNFPAFAARDRLRVRRAADEAARLLHGWLRRALDQETAASLGLDLDTPIEVHSLRPAQRVTADGEPRTDLVAVITQKKMLPVDRDRPKGEMFPFRGGCTLLLDRGYDADCPIRYAISRPLTNTGRADRIRAYQYGAGLADQYGDETAAATREPFALVHRALRRE